MEREEIDNAMPYASKKQEHFMEMCRSNPGNATKDCPPKKVTAEFHRASYPSETTASRHQQKKRGGVKYL